MWLQINRRKDFTAISTLTLITPRNKEYTLQPYNNYPTTLAVTYDRHRGITFGQHRPNINTQAKSRLNVLRALTSTCFGHTKEEITQIYKQYIRPILSYAHLSREPNTENTHIYWAQTTQNSALRVATGCTSSTPVHQLYHETRVLPPGRTQVNDGNTHERL